LNYLLAYLSKYQISKCPPLFNHPLISKLKINNIAKIAEAIYTTSIFICSDPILQFSKGLSCLRGLCLVTERNYHVHEYNIKASFLSCQQGWFFPLYLFNWFKLFGTTFSNVSADTFKFEVIYPLLIVWIIISL
jgi:hypothetical protein